MKSGLNASIAALEPAGDVVVQRLLGADVVQDLGLLGLEEVEELPLPLADVLDLDVVEMAVGDGVDDGHLLLDRHRPVLRLLEHLDQPGPAGELPLGGGVEVGAELGERLELAVLRQREPERARHLLHRLDLRVAADAAHADAGVHRGPDVGEEEVGRQEDLAVGDRDDVGRDVGRDVTRLGLDDRERRERAARLLDAGVELGELGDSR